MEIEKKCSYCGKQFLAQMLITRYCSHKCNQAHYRKKQKQKKIVANKKPPLQNDEIIPYDAQLISIKAKDLLSLNDVMKLLGMSRSSIHRLIKNKHLKSAKFGARVFIRKKDLKSLINNQFENEYSENIILNEAPKKDINGYFSIGEITKLYNLSRRTIARSLTQNNINKVKNGKFVYVLKSDVLKLFGKPTNTPIKNG